MYCASSSRRACTLKLPSVVLSRALSWLKLNDSLTASALTMPRRTRSWISRSSSAAREPPRSLLRPCSTASVFRAAPCLATVPPSNDHTEPDVQAAEPRGHEPVAPRRRPEQRRGAHQHEAEAQPGDEPNQECHTHHEHLAPARHRGKRSGPLHRLPDEAEVVERAVVQGPRGDHDTHDVGSPLCCQVLCNTKQRREIALTRCASTSPSTWRESPGSSTSPRPILQHRRSPPNTGGSGAS